MRARLARQRSSKASTLQAGLRRQLARDKLRKGLLVSRLVAVGAVAFAVEGRLGTSLGLDDGLATDVEAMLLAVAVTAVTAAADASDGGELLHDLHAAASRGIGDALDALDASVETIALAIMRATAPTFGRHTLDRGLSHAISEPALCHLWAQSWVISLVSNRVANPPSHLSPGYPCGPEGAHASELAVQSQSTCTLLPEDLKLLAAMAIGGGTRVAMIMDSFAAGRQGLFAQLMSLATAHSSTWAGRWNRCQEKGSRLPVVHRDGGRASRHAAIRSDISDSGSEAGCGGRETDEFKVKNVWFEHKLWDRASDAEHEADGRAELGTWVSQFKQIQRVFAAYELRPRAVKVSIADKDGRATNGRVKQGVRWAAPESSSSSEEDEASFCNKALDSAKALQASRAAYRAENRRFLDSDHGYLAAMLTAALVEHRVAASGFPPESFSSICAMLQRTSADGSAVEFQAVLLQILARICRHNSRAGQRLSKIAWLPGFLNACLASTASDGEGAPPDGVDVARAGGKKRRAASCQCRQTAVAASKLVTVLVANCHVDVRAYWQHDRALLGLLWLQVHAEASI